MGKYLISGPLGLMPAILGSGHQEVAVFSSLPYGFKTSLPDLSIGLWRLKEVGSCSCSATCDLGQVTPWTSSNLGVPSLKRGWSCLASRVFL